ncbi:MAG TPA: selenium metabolism-associated LysR family transcriptional regulator [candidate division Zixibacteria bacterium]|nr:selenium metabolism-associated LysR family transcriptional regulator [candidate division Zixibacteria bacterium]
MGKLRGDLDLHKLEVFYWVADLKSFSRAAEHLSLTQPTVSGHIQELERALGGSLFYRVRGEVVLTALGEVLLEHARGLLALKRQAVAAVENFQRTPKGELWVGGSNNPGEYVLPQKLGAFVNRYPDVKPILKIADSAGIVEAVLDGRVELGFVGFPVEDARLRVEKIWQDEMVLTVPRDHPWSRRKAVAVEEIFSERFISREQGSGTLGTIRNLLRRAAGGRGRDLKVIMELGSSEAVKEAVIAGSGISILSRVSIRRELDAGLLAEVPVRGLRFQRDFFEIFHNRRPLTPVSIAFRKFLRA